MIINIFNIIKENLGYNNYQNCSSEIDKKILKYQKSQILNLKWKIIFTFLLIILFLFIYFYSFNFKFNIICIKTFINDCRNLKIYNKINHNKEINPYLSICIPAFNMEKYIEKALLSLINQSFQNFEIIITNDNSNDNTEKIIKNYQLKDNRIKIIQHEKNLGVYKSRIDSAINSNGEFILFIDPDDMLINGHLLEELYKYNLKYNLDMIEFTVYHQEEGKKKIYYPIYHEFSHFHHYNEKIIYQPELSNLIYYIPNTKKHTAIICRTIWNKIIRKNVLMNSIEYIERFFNHSFLITADDTPINILNFNFAKNYSNLKIPGYLYNIRKNSISRIGAKKKNDIIISYNFLLFYEFFYKYVKDFKKDLDYLFYDLKLTYSYILRIQDLEERNYISKAIDFFIQIFNDDISIEFKNFSENIILKLKKQKLSQFNFKYFFKYFYTFMISLF